MLPPIKASTARSLSDLRAKWPLDATLRNLSGLLEQAFETSARLRVFALEASHEGLEECVRTYERLDRMERDQIVELEAELQRQLVAALAAAQHAPGEETERIR